MLFTRRRANALEARHFPRELTDAILDVLREERAASLSPTDFTDRCLQPTLAAAAQVCRQWYGASIKLLYSDVCLSSSKSLAALSRTLAVDEELRGFVDSFLFARTPMECGDPAPSSTNRRHLELIHRVCPRLQLARIARNMNVGCVDGVHYWNPPDAHPLRTSALGTDKLTSLELSTADYSLVDILLPTTSLPALRELVLHGFVIEDGIVSDGEENSAQLAWPYMPALRRLCLRRCFLMSASPLPTPEDAPELRELEIDEGCCGSETFASALHALAPRLELLQLSHHAGLDDIDWLRFPALVELRLPFNHMFSFHRLVFTPALRRVVLWDRADVPQVHTFYDKELPEDLSLITVGLRRENCPGLESIWVCTRSRRLLAFKAPLRRNGNRVGIDIDFDTKCTSIHSTAILIRHLLGL